MGFCQAKQCVPDSRETGHEPWGLHSQRIPAKPSAAIDTVENDGRQACGLGTPSWFSQFQTGLLQQFQIAEVAVTKRVVTAKAMCQSRLKGSVDFRPDLRIIKVTERKQAAKADTWSAMTP